MADRKSDFALPTLDDLFSTQEERDDARLEKIRDIPLDLIDDFPDHPFHVRDDEDMVQLHRSISWYLYSIRSCFNSYSIQPTTYTAERSRFPSIF